MTSSGRGIQSHRAAAVAAWIVLAWAGRGWAANPSTIYVYPYGSQHGESLMASLSGVVARTSPEVFMAIQGSNPNHDPEFWLNKFVADDDRARRIDALQFSGPPGKGGERCAFFRIDREQAAAGEDEHNVAVGNPQIEQPALLCATATSSALA